MLTSFYTAAVGAIAQQNGIDVSANNISNISTNGYKADENVFADLLHTNIHADGNDNLKTGHGTKLGAVDTVFTQGSLQNTGRSLDYALGDANTFFAIRTSDGSIRYTRNGAFSKSMEANGKTYLSDNNGGYVLDAAGKPVVITNEEEKQNIGVYSFGNLDGLLKSGDNYYRATNVSGNAHNVKNANIKQGCLESSSADMATEMSNIITSERAFDFNAKVVQISDEIMQTVNNLR